ncbi:MAG: hypothetical protein K0R50_3172 [Eubacterium sp.]|jgi:hypothetical protein|nr:hypothetical protein [Eubacterium sp.]
MIKPIFKGDVFRKGKAAEGTIFSLLHLTTTQNFRKITPKKWEVTIYLLHI